jgi:arginyl-tRNA synthetase
LTKFNTKAIPIFWKDLIQEGLIKGILFRKDDGSVWCDLTDEGLDQNYCFVQTELIYMTQDLGTAVQRFKDNDIQKLIYTVGNEQDYHFDVLFKILKLSYGRKTFITCRTEWWNFPKAK